MIRIQAYLPTPKTNIKRAFCEQFEVAHFQRQTQGHYVNWPNAKVPNARVPNFDKKSMCRPVSQLGKAEGLTKQLIEHEMGT
jgi:hypothetical protein